MKKTLLVLAVSCALLVTGCQKGAEASANTALAKDGVSIKTDGDSGTTTTMDGSMTFTAGDNAKAPDGFPADIQLYPGAKIVSGMSLPNGLTVALESGDALAKVEDYYKTSLAKGGLTQEGVVSAAGSAMLSFNQAKKSLQLTIRAANSACMWKRGGCRNGPCRI